MIDLGSTEFYFPIEMLPRIELEAYSHRLFNSWEPYISKIITLEDYSVSLEIEEGSINGRGKILAAIGTVWIGISSYGSFIQGLQIIRSQALAATDYLANNAKSEIGAKVTNPEVRNRSGTLGKIQKLFIKVQQREMTAAEAYSNAEKILGEESKKSPEFMIKLSDSLYNTPVFGEQISLDLIGSQNFDLISHDDECNLIEEKINRRQIPRKSNQLKIEIRRDTKYGEKNISITEK